MNGRYITAQAPIFSYRSLAFVLSQLEEIDEAIPFVKRFTGPWPSRIVDTGPWYWSSDLEHISEYHGTLAYHSRVLLPKEAHDAGSSLGSLEGILCDRENGIFPSLGTLIIEKRFSVALHTTLSLELPMFVLVIISDFDGYTRSIGDRDKWSEAEILPCLECTGYSAFQIAVRDFIYAFWSRNWNALLELIDKALTANVKFTQYWIENIG